ncbi:hypothetical protein [Oligoflexus tunisiensis]|nr:hypothetical protein [Oligoflexus tunisiensis]
MAQRAEKDDRHSHDHHDGRRARDFHKTGAFVKDTLSEEDRKSF